MHIHGTSVYFTCHRRRQLFRRIAIVAVYVKLGQAELVCREVVMSRKCSRHNIGACAVLVAVELVGSPPAAVGTKQLKSDIESRKTRQG
jgi:hypothetical protein